MRLRTIAFLASLSVTAIGCARGPNVSADGLALRRVVIYRNGVGYFERHGLVEDEEIEFRVRPEQVGDFLASLAVMEEGGSSVRSASFPIEVEEDDEPEEPVPPPTPIFKRPGEPTPPPPAPKKKKDKLKKVVLRLDGEERVLSVGYIAETPVWKPSYRLVVHEKGAELQSWGIVQNLSGEDWENVQLSLVAGAPLAFEATLGTPVIPKRPVVTDQGEVIAAVPKGETSLAELAPPPPAAAPDIDDYEEDEEGRMGRAEAAPKKAEMGLGSVGLVGRGAGGGASAKPRVGAQPAASAPMNPSPPRDLSALAAIAVEAGTTRYDIPTPITVPDKSATMVMLVSKRVPGEAIFLFAPDGGVSDSFRHPFRVARFTNQTGGLLERGPIAIFENGSFLGQGVVEPLPDGATATVPFALERSLAVEKEQRTEEVGSRIARIEAGVLYIDRDYATKTTYRVRNGGEEAKLLVKHARAYQSRLHEPPPGTEDNVGTGTALVPVLAKARATTELVVDERRAIPRAVDWLSELADEAVKAYWQHPKADKDVAAKLQAAWKIRETLVRATQERTALGNEQYELERMSDETRRNLKAIEKNPTAADLREELTRRLTQATRRLDEITKRAIELDMTINEQRIRFDEAVRNIKLNAG